MTAYLDHKDLANCEIDTKRAQEIADATKRTLDHFYEALAQSHRSEDSARLLAATKTRDVGEIMVAIKNGIRLIGENRPQEIEIKADLIGKECCQQGLTMGWNYCNNGIAANGKDGDFARKSEDSLANPEGDATVEFHLIGQLQKNKINKVLPWVQVIESVDSVEKAEQISQRAKGPIGVLLEVNESGEDTKSGCDPQQAFAVAQEIAAMPNIILNGLMTIGAHTDDEERIRAGFSHLRETRDKLLATHDENMKNCHELSMGMSHDYLLALLEGATIVRLGTAIFGERAFI